MHGDLPLAVLYHGLAVLDLVFLFDSILCRQSNIKTIHSNGQILGTLET